MTALFMTAVLGFLPLVLPASNGEEAFLQGNRLYLEGRFLKALQAYEEAFAFDENLDLILYNQGCCLFRLGRYGEALHRFYGSRALRPRDGRVRKNIRAARARLGLDRVPLYDAGLLPRLRVLTFREYAAASAFLFSAALLLWAFSLLRSSRRAGTAATAAGVAGAVVLLCGLLAGTAGGGSFGLAVRPCEVLTEPSPAAGELSFTLREGEAVRMEGRRAGWHQVADGEGRTGWVRDTEVLPLP